MPPRASKRKATASHNSSSVTSADDSPTGTITGLDNVILIAPSDKTKTKKTDRLDTLFDSYANCSSGIIEKLKAQRQGYFTRDEWRSGMKALKVDSLSKLKKGLPELEKEVNTPGNFQDFYSYAFDTAYRFSLTISNKLGSMDGFLRFCKEISFPDLENYDADLAWPLILDNFVDWMKETAVSAVLAS
uniref:Defective in cullin neddylation protein n=1 Tax=Salix viminalis TaxID=40686 RepID=A0A6N2MDV2_SALVM